MFFRKSIYCIISTSMVLCGSAALAADDARIYAGFGAGATRMDVGINNMTGGAAHDDSDTGYKIFAGIKKPMSGIPGIGALGVEGFYANLGETTLTGNSGSTFTYADNSYTFTANNVSVKTEGQVFGVGGVAYFPVTKNASIHGKIGLARWDFESTASAPAVGAFSIKKNSIDFYFGIGASYNVSKNLAIGLDHERYTLSNELDDADFTSLTLKYMY